MSECSVRRLLSSKIPAYAAGRVPSTGDAWIRCCSLNIKFWGKIEFECRVSHIFAKPYQAIVYSGKNSSLTPRRITSFRLISKLLPNKTSPLKHVVSDSVVCFLHACWEVLGEQALRAVCSGVDAVATGTIGHLPAMYAQCAIAFVGGSLLPTGKGHNVVGSVLWPRWSLESQP